MFDGVKHPHPPAERRALSPNSLQIACPKNDSDSGKLARGGREIMRWVWWCHRTPLPRQHFRRCHSSPVDSRYVREDTLLRLGDVLPIDQHKEKGCGMLRFAAVFALQASLICLGGLHALGQDVREHSWGDSSAAVLQREKITLEKGPKQYPRSLMLTGKGEIMGAEAEIEYVFFDDKLCRAAVTWRSNFNSERACLALTNKLGKPDSNSPGSTPAYVTWKTPRMDVMATWPRPTQGVVLWESLIEPTWKKTDVYRKSQNLSSDSKDF